LDVAELAQTIGELKGGFAALSVTIQNTQDQQREDVGKLFAGLNSVKLELSKLPCSTHADRLDKAENWQKCHNGAVKESNMKKAESNWSLRNGLVLTLASLLSSGIGGILIYWLTIGFK